GRGAPADGRIAILGVDVKLTGLTEEKLIGSEIRVVGAYEVILDVDAVQSDACEGDALTIDYSVGFSVEGHAWFQLNQGQGLAAINRQIVELLLINLISDRRVGGLHLVGSSRFDRYGLGHRADLEYDGRDGELRRRVELQVRNGGGLESLLIDVDPVKAEVQALHRISAIGSRSRLILDASVLACNGNCGSCHSGFLCIQHGSHD